MCINVLCGRIFFFKNFELILEISKYEKFAQFMKLRGLRPHAWVFYSQNRQMWGYASFEPYEKFAGGRPPTETPTQKLKSGFVTLSSQKIGSVYVS